jgi:protease I
MGIVRKGFILLLPIIILASFQWWEKVEEGKSFDLNGKRILFVVGDDFDWLEVTELKNNLENWGAKVDIASTKKSLTGHLWDRKDNKWFIKEQKELTADLLLNEVKIEEYHALFIPGGKGPENLLKEAKETTLSLIKKASAEGKVISAICHGPWLLAEAEVIEGKTITGHPEIWPIMKEKGGKMVREKVVVDGNIITGNWPFFGSFSVKMAEKISGR